MNEKIIQKVARRSAHKNYDELKNMGEHCNNFEPTIDADDEWWFFCIESNMPENYKNEKLSKIFEDIYYKTWYEICPEWRNEFPQTPSWYNDLLEKYK